MSSDAKRPTFTREQIEAYFDRIHVPKEHRKHSIASLEPEEQLGYLTLLQRLHLVEIPFENLTLHYSHHRQISIHPEELFRKIVGDDNGRGGYCMENNCLFGTLLHSLGFDVYAAGARVFAGGNWSGWSHMINIISIDDRQYHVDVGFGANGPIEPMVLDKSESIQAHISPASARLQWRNIPGNTSAKQRLWVYEHRNDDQAEFGTVYCFTELEFLPSDFNIMNFYTSTSPKTFFTRTLVAEKKILGEDGKTLAGSLILNHADLKWRIKGKNERKITFESEEDRVRAIGDHFGVRLGEVEKDGIKGLVSELR